MVVWDLLLGIIVLGLLAAGLFYCGRMVAGRSPRWLTAATAVATLALTLAFAVAVHGRLILARFLPFPNVIVVGNWIPLGAAFLAGIVARERAIPCWRRVVVLGMLTALASYTVAYELLAAGLQPEQPRFLDGVCMQTTPSSCSACCAVALLMSHKIPATEGELMTLCLTRPRGTPELGLYRGLKLKTRHTAWCVETFRCDVDTLRRSSSFPVVLLVEMNPEYSRGLAQGGMNRTNHAIVVHGFRGDGSAEVGNPSSGRQRWSVDKLRRQWFGDGLRLVPRQAADEAAMSRPRRNFEDISTIRSREDE